MRFPGLGKISKNQMGFTLIELMMAIAITGIISTGVTMTFYQVVTGGARVNNRVTAISQVQHAGYWVTNSAQLAQNVVVNDDDPTGFPLFLSWVGWDNKEHEVTYSLEDTAGGLKELKQSVVVGDEDAVEIIVARFINPATTPEPGPNETYVEYIDITGDGLEDTVILRVSVIVGSGREAQVETRVYRIVPRPRS
jgi:prepilin-type N-terminal cleavage/methylation domain-containing protein